MNLFAISMENSNTANSFFSSVALFILLVIYTTGSPEDLNTVFFLALDGRKKDVNNIDVCHCCIDGGFGRLVEASEKTHLSSSMTFFGFCNSPLVCIVPHLCCRCSLKLAHKPCLAQHSKG